MQAALSALPGDALTATPGGAQGARPGARVLTWGDVQAAARGDKPGVSPGAASGVTPAALSGARPGAASGMTQAARTATAPGLFRTFAYVGAIFSSGLIGINFGHAATDSGFHRLARVLAGTGVVVTLLAVFDTALPVAANRPAPADGQSPPAISRA